MHNHLLGLARLVLEHGGDEEQAMPAVRHDAIKDCGAEQKSIFGSRVFSIMGDAPTPTRSRSALEGAHGDLHRAF